MSDKKPEKGGRSGRVVYWTVAAVCVSLGLMGRQLDVPWLANHLGGFFYVFFWSCLILGAFPRQRPGPLVGFVLAATCGLEFLQLWHPPFLESVRATRPGAMLLGTTFLWEDFPAYFVGALAAWALSAFILARR